MYIYVHICTYITCTYFISYVYMIYIIYIYLAFDIFLFFLNSFLKKFLIIKQPRIYSKYYFISYLWDVYLKEDDSPKILSVRGLKSQRD